MIPAALRAETLGRDSHRCVRCGTNVYGREYSLHHRRARGMGGTKTKDTPSNLLTLCGSGTTGCHGWVESYRTEAEAAGYLVRRGIADPADIPVVTHLGSLLFTDDGTVTEAAA